MYIFSDLESPTCRTLPYAFMHQSWCKHMHPFTPLRNDLNSIFAFDNPSHSLCTYPPISIQMTQAKLFSFPFKEFFLSPTSIKYCAYSFLICDFINTSIITKLAFCVTYSMMSTSNPYKIRLPDYKTPCVLCPLMSTVHNHNIQHILLLPIIHSMLSIYYMYRKLFPLKLMSKKGRKKTIIIEVSMIYI